MRVILTYDVENVGECVPKLRTVSKVHRGYEAPITIFVTGLVIEEDGCELRRLLDEAPAMWDVNSHTYSHARVICKPPWSLPVPSAEFIHEETTRGVGVVRDRLDRPCRGFRPRSGAGAGFRGCLDNLNSLRSVGVLWTSAYLKSVFGDSLPGDLSGPFSYAADGFDEIIEMPGHGWQDCGVKDFGRGSQYAIRWPSPFAYPSRFVETPAEEFEVHRATLDAALAAKLPFCCFVMHPWTMIRRQDPDGKAIDLLLDYAKLRGCEFSTLDTEAQRCRENPQLLKPAPPVPPQRTVNYDVGRIFA